MNLNRREFLLSSTALLGMLSFVNQVFGLASANKRKVALIGAGWYGKSDLFRLLQVADVEVVAVCDVDRLHLENAGKLIAQKQQSGNKPALYKDYKLLFKDHKPELVLIGTPDHWHALIAIEAMLNGAHVYLQKPISLDVLEGEAILNVARKYNKKVQIGVQRRSTAHIIDAKDQIIAKGKLGKISHVEMCCYYHMRNNTNPSEQSVPEFLDYELWTGPAALRPYEGLPHAGYWRAFMEYGNGITGDMGVHMLDTVRWMLGLGWPKKISAVGGIYVQKSGKSNIADTQTAIFEYEELNCIWTHRTWGSPADQEYPWSFIMYGDKGTLKASTLKYEFIPFPDGEKISKEALYEREEFPDDLKEDRIELHTAAATRSQMKDLIQSIEFNKLPVADIEEGHISTASCILANLAMLLKRPLSYDPKNKICINDPEATGLLKRTYRKGWTHPYDLWLQGKL